MPRHQLTTSQKTANTIQSIDRAINVLECFTSGRHELGVTEISKLLELHKSTVHGILTTLEYRRYLEQNPETGKYKLGLKLFELGNLVQDGMDLKVVAGPFLQRLVEEHGETVHLVIMDQGEAVYIDKRDSHQSMRMVSQVGKRLPCHCTGVGKTLLAFLPEEQLEAVIREKGLARFTGNTITEPAALKEHLREVRQRGYAIDDQEITEGLTCVAAPIRNHTGNVVAAMSVAGPSIRMGREKIGGIIISVTKAAEELSEKLGYVK
ncbi:IclR family transcriptional regulator [Clostridiales bacterium PH28_bin88]|nr:IclR family transcriptional regulator [Clostridiales bacterium PH28_bin88]